ncbi:MAG: 50S ribosomal protein L23 [Candidatus Magasanikbacteria bacterium]
MGILDRFKKKKESQLEELGKKPTSVAPEQGGEKKAPKAQSKSKTENVEKKKVGVAAKATYGKAHRVLVSPLVSEKAAVAEAEGKYTFMVDPAASKTEIKKAIKSVYGTTPQKVRVMNIEGKRVRFGSQFGRRKDWKKAVVTMPKGKTISIHESV